MAPCPGSVAALIGERAATMLAKHIAMFVTMPRSRWSVVDTQGHLMANEITGTYYGRSQAHKPRHTEGVLFSTDLATNKRAHYHCINWNEL